MPCRYHYHLGFPLPPHRSDDLRQKLAAMALPPEQAEPRDSTPLFLSVIQIAESALQHPFLRQRCAAAFDRPLPPAVDFHFRRLRFDKEGARLTVCGKSQDAGRLMAQLARLLAAQGVALPQPPRQAAATIGDWPISATAAVSGFGLSLALDADGIGLDRGRSSAGSAAHPPPLDTFGPRPTQLCL